MTQDITPDSPIPLLSVLPCCFSPHSTYKHTQEHALLPIRHLSRDDEDVDLGLINIQN